MGACAYVFLWRSGGLDVIEDLTGSRGGHYRPEAVQGDRHDDEMGKRMRRTSHCRDTVSCAG